MLKYSLKKHEMKTEFSQTPLVSKTNFFFIQCSHQNHRLQFCFITTAIELMFQLPKYCYFNKYNFLKEWQYTVINKINDCGIIILPLTINRNTDTPK